ncbi:MAG: phosphoribosyl-AMP cyclohydrolase [Pseudomonadota bacterium]
MTGQFITSLKFDERGLIPAIAQQHDTGEVLMQAFMNAASIEETLKTGRVTYWSRSRAALWKKGETSGHIQKLIDFRVDCDRDSVLVLVDQVGPACHTKRRTCYYTAFRDGSEVELLTPPKK